LHPWKANARPPSRKPGIFGFKWHLLRALVSEDDSNSNKSLMLTIPLLSKSRGQTGSASLTQGSATQFDDHIGSPRMSAPATISFVPSPPNRPRAPCNMTAITLWLKKNPCSSIDLTTAIPYGSTTSQFRVVRR
jgi:hypothetical protein